MLVNKDILELICLKLDLPDLVSFLQTSKEIHSKISDIFWMNKVKHDFNLSTSKEQAHKYYLELNDYIKRFPNNFDLFKIGNEKKRVDLAKIAYDKGLNFTEIVADKSSSIRIVFNFFIFIELLKKKNDKLIVLTVLFENLLPIVSIFITKRDKRFWSVALEKLEEFKPDFGIERYNKLKPFYEKMTL